MSRDKFFALDAFIAFFALNVYALVTAGISGLFAITEEVNAWSLVLGVDLLIALGMISVWVWRDARQRGVNPLPYLLVTLCTGSLGPLAYLLVRPQKPRQESRQPVTQHS